MQNLLKDRVGGGQWAFVRLDPGDSGQSSGRISVKPGRARPLSLFGEYRVPASFSQLRPAKNILVPRPLLKTGAANIGSRMVSAERSHLPTSATFDEVESDEPSSHYSPALDVSVGLQRSDTSSQLGIFPSNIPKWLERCRTACF